MWRAGTVRNNWLRVMVSNSFLYILFIRQGEISSNQKEKRVENWKSTGKLLVPNKSAKIRLE